MKRKQEEENEKASEVKRVDRKKNEENESNMEGAQFTNLDRSIEKNSEMHSIERKAMRDEVFEEIKLLKKEIVYCSRLYKQLRPLINFEEDFKTTEARVVFYNPVLFFEKTKKIMGSKNFQSSKEHNKNLDKDLELRKCVGETMEYYNEVKELPLLYILKNSKKIISSEEWAEAYEEQVIFKKLDRYERMKVKFSKIVAENSKDKIIERKKQIELEKDKIFVEKTKLMAKKLAEECKSFCKNNIIYESDEIQICNFENIYYRKDIDNKAMPIDEDKEYLIRRFNDAFTFIKNNKSKSVFDIPQIKPGGITTHSSHLATLNKIPPELSKTTNPEGIAEYRNRIRLRQNNNNYYYGRVPQGFNTNGYQQNIFGQHPIQSQGMFQQTLMSPGSRMNQGTFQNPYIQSPYKQGFTRGPISGNVTFNIRNDNLRNRRGS